MDQMESINALQSFLSEGRVVGLCWAQLKPKGPKVPRDDDLCTKLISPEFAFCTTTSIFDRIPNGLLGQAIQDFITGN